MMLNGKNAGCETKAARFRDGWRKAAAAFGRHVLGIEPPAPRQAEPPKTRQQVLDERLFDAAKEGKTELAEHLISQGADPRAMKGWMTVINWALQFGKLEFAEWAANHGAVGRLDIETYRLSHGMKSCL